MGHSQSHTEEADFQTRALVRAGNRIQTVLHLRSKDREHRDRGQFAWAKAELCPVQCHTHQIKGYIGH